MNLKYSILQTNDCLLLNWFLINVQKGTALSFLQGKISTIHHPQPR